MNGKINGDGNLIGRLGAAALLIAAGVGLRNLSVYGQMCPMKTGECCGATDVKAEAPAAAPEPVKLIVK